MPPKRTIEEILEILKAKDYFYIDSYMENNNTRVEFKDSTGYKYDLVLSWVRDNSGHYFVSKGNKYSLHNISLWLSINNKGFKLDEDNVYETANKKLKFNCSVCKESFYSTWGNTTGFGCPYCAGKSVGKYNSLSYLRPDLLNEWSYKNNILPINVTLNSGIVVIWICKLCKNEWKAPIYRKVSSVSGGCPFCSGRLPTKEYNLANIFKDLILEWNYDLNISSPDNYSPYSNNKVWWTCDACGHVWKAKINARTREKSGCPKCSFSKGELKIFYYLENNKILNFQQHKFEECKHKNKLPFDFYLPEYNACIEYHGEQHYEVLRNKFFGGEKELLERQFRDSIKTEYCKNNNINLLIIPYWEFDNIEKILYEYLFETP